MATSIMTRRLGLNFRRTGSDNLRAFSHVSHVGFRGQPVDQSAPGKFAVGKPMMSARTLHGTTKRTMSSMPETTEFIKSKIESNQVVVFSKTYCPSCSATKRLFKTMGVDAEVIELDINKDGDSIQNELQKMTGQRSVPNVFVNGQHVGGNDDTQAAARSGKLKEMLE